MGMAADSVLRLAAQVSTMAVRRQGRGPVRGPYQSACFLVIDPVRGPVAAGVAVPMTITNCAGAPGSPE